MKAYDDPLYRELIPCRPSPSWHDPADGPTAQFLELEREREKWLLLSEIGDDEEAVA